MRLGLGVAAVAVAFAIVLGCSSGGGEDTETEASGVESQPRGTQPNRIEDIPPPFEVGDPALDGLRFTEVGEQAGFTETHTDLEIEGYEAATSGAAVGDVDGDGDLDVFLPRLGKPDGLYLNDGTGHFTDVAAEAGVAGPIDRFGSNAAVFADFDSDGRMDLFVAGAGPSPDNLFINEGDGTFSDRTSDSGISFPAEADPDGDTHGVSVADVDGDGDMDLLVLEWYSELLDNEAATEVIAQEFAEDGAVTAEPPACEVAALLRNSGFPRSEDVPEPASALFLNDGSGRFEDATAEFGLPLDEIVALTGVFTDLDGDGWQDLSITGDFCTSRVFRNVEGERFEDDTANAGVGTDENGMGAAVGDIDRDGRPDWFITSISAPGSDPCIISGCSGNRLFLNEGDLRFADATDDLGLRDSGWGWGTAIEDFDNDGTPEVVATNGFRAEGIDDPARGGSPFAEFFAPFAEDHTRFWVLDGETYRDASAAVGLDDTSVGHGLVPFDMDGDGDLDILITPHAGTPRLFRNDLSAPDRWLSVSLDTESGGGWGDGARVEVIAGEGDEPATGWISTSGSYESQSPPRFHVGLGQDVEVVDRVVVHWGPGRDPTVLEGVAPNQQLVVEP